MSHDRDNELDELLGALRSEEPGELKLQKWKRAIRLELARGRETARRGFGWKGLSAAAAAGFAVAALAFALLQRHGDEPQVAVNFGAPVAVVETTGSGDATVEYISVKSQ